MPRAAAWTNVDAPVLHCKQQDVEMRDGRAGAKQRQPVVSCYTTYNDDSQLTMTF
jgi:hypothetical protein